MRLSDEWLMYVGAVGLFAAVVLWATTMTPIAPIAVAAAGLALVLAGLVRAQVTERVLVVGRRRSEIVDVVGETLDAAGYGTVSCDGPWVHPCPVEGRGTCPVHASVSGIVIVREGDEPLPRCGEVLRAPVVSVEPTDEGLRTLRASLGS